MEIGDISREQAAAALATIEESRGLVQSERTSRRGRHHALVALGALTTIVDYAAMDFIRSRARRWALGVGGHVAMFAVGKVIIDESRAIRFRMPLLRPESMKSMKWQGVKTTAAITGMVVTERLVVHGLRRSRLRRPNLVAGFLIAGLRIGFRSLVLERLSLAGRTGDELAALTARLHRALLLPDTLRIAALLGDGDVIDLAFVRDAFGIGQLDVAEDLQPLFDDELAKITVHKDSAMVYLTPEGREAYAQHLRALHDVSTGDTPR